MLIARATPADLNRGNVAWRTVHRRNFLNSACYGLAIKYDLVIGWPVAISKGCGHTIQVQSMPQVDGQMSSVMSFVLHIIPH